MNTPPILNMEQRQLRDAALLIARTFGIAGNVWQHRRPTTNKLRLPENPPSVDGAAYGYLVKLRPITIYTTAPGTNAGVEQYRFYEFGRMDINNQLTGEAQDLQPGDVLTHPTQPITFTLSTPGLNPGYLDFSIEYTP